MILLTMMVRTSQASIVLLPVTKLQNWPRNPLTKPLEKIPLEPRAKTRGHEFKNWTFAAAIPASQIENLKLGVVKQ
jgi:hypothetical protein